MPQQQPNADDPARSPAYAMTASLPETVYVPAHPSVRRGRGEIEYEVRRLEDGRTALPAFTTIGRLVETLGPSQPWAQLPLRAARALMTLAGVSAIVVDPPEGTDTWRWTEHDLNELRKSLP